LQAASTSGKPVLLRVDYEAGHGVGSTEKQIQGVSPRVELPAVAIRCA